MVEDYNRKSKMHVQSIGLEHESFKSGIKNMLAWGNPPDIFSYWAGARLQAVVDAGQVASLDGLWEKDGLENEFSPGVVQACRYNGRFYAIPVTQHLVGFFYNKAIFSRLGLQPPRTWSQFLDACERIRQAGVSPIAMGSRELWPAQYWFDFILLRTFGLEYRQELMDGTRSFTDSQVRATFETWAQLLRKGYFHPSYSTWDWADAADAVHRGDAAMTLMGTWVLGYFQSGFNWRLGDEYGFFEFPAITPGLPDVVSGPIDALVLTPSGEAHGALDAMSFFAGKEPQQAMCLGAGAFPPNVHAEAGIMTPERAAIAGVIREAKVWAFPYDLAEPPAIADVGLGLFGAFMKDPGSIDGLLESAQMKMSMLRAVK